MQNITIKVSESGNASARTFSYEILIDGKSRETRVLTPVETVQVREMAGQYFSLFRSAKKADTDGYLPILRDEMAHLFWQTGKAEADWRTEIQPGARLTILSDISGVLELPWELLSIIDSRRHENRGDFSVIRSYMAADGPAPRHAGPSSGPLRVLFLACEQPGYEEEERAMLMAAEGLDMETVICESAKLEVLKKQAESFRPHILHLAGQAKISGEDAVFLMPGDFGHGNSLTAKDLSDAFSDCGLPCIILSGRQRDSASALHLLSQKLSQTIPMAVAWDASTKFARPLYQELATGRSLEQALLLLREKASQASPDSTGQGLLSAPLPVPALYSTGSQTEIINPHMRSAEPSVLPCRELFCLPGLKEGWAECFVGRRMENDGLVPALMDGGIRTLILTGAEGAGKSTLAVHLACMMTTPGYTILPVYSSPHNPITGIRLLEAASALLINLGREIEAKGLADSRRNVRERLESLLDLLRSSRAIILLDDLALDEKTNRIPDTDLAGFYIQMLRSMGMSRTIITCRALPADALTLPARARHWQLSGLDQAAFIRFLLGKRAIADRYKNGEITYSLLAGHHLAASGIPRLLPQIARALCLGDLPFGADPLAALVSRMSPESYRALCLAAVYRIAMSTAGIAAVSGLKEEQAKELIRQWQELSLAYEVGDIWAIPSSLCDQLQRALSPEDLRLANRAAGSFLRDLAEAGNSTSLSLSRLDVMLEARGHFMASEDWNSAFAVTARISGYLKRRGYHSMLIGLNRELLDKLPESTAPIIWIAEAELDCGEHRKAADWYSRALQISPDASTYHGLGLAHLGEGKLDLAKDDMEKAVDAYRAADDSTGEASSLKSLAGIDLKMGQNAKALERMKRVEEIMRLQGDVPGLAAALQEAARLEMIEGRHDDARQMLVSSLQLLESSGNLRGASFALFNLASLDLEKGDFEHAGEEFSRALPGFREMGDRAGEAAILHSLGMVQSHAGEKEKAEKSFREALFINQDLEDRAAEAGSFFQLGVLAVQQDRIREGLQLMAMAAVILRSIKSEEVKNVEPLVERLASQLKYSQEQFMLMVQEVLQNYAKDRGRGLVERTWGR